MQVAPRPGTPEKAKRPWLYLVELYSPSPAWEILSDDHRRVFLDGIAKGMAELGTLGIEMLTLSEVAPRRPTLYASPFRRHLALPGCDRSGRFTQGHPR
ncbi:DUF6616 family protein [Burkholderia cepacia]|uniref:DUF6616 family protein n=2 Tax=Burkholderiaceae TaxID=119060 RepID=UPI00299E17E1|nr:DUF6616 family protein [Burkholderia cepacia]